VGTVSDNVRAAAEAGLSRVGISDHGPGHRFYGIDVGKVPNMRKDIEEAKAVFPEVEILLGLEANIINESGRLDVSPDEQALFDYVMAGYHYGAFGEEPAKAIGICVGGWCTRVTGRVSAAALRYNTDLIIRALQDNDIFALTHPGDKIAMDIGEIAKVCAARGTLMEINERHKALDTDGIIKAAAEDVSFIIGSDAHRPADVGLFSDALARLSAAGIPPERVINLSAE
jgi:putative hydrolase